MITKLKGRKVAERHHVWPNSPLKFKEMPIWQSTPPGEIQRAGRVYLTFRGIVVSKYRPYIDGRGRYKGDKEHALTKKERALFGVKLDRATKRWLEKAWKEEHSKRAINERERKIKKTVDLFHAMILGYTAVVMDHTGTHRYRFVDVWSLHNSTHRIRLCEVGKQDGADVIIPIEGVGPEAMLWLANRFNPDYLPFDQWPDAWIQNKDHKPIWELKC